MRALAAVEDPELPVSIVDLGMVRAVTVRGSRAVVELVPTFLACPALWMVESEVRRSVTALPGVAECEVAWRAGGWSGADVTEAGRRALAGAGLAAPAAGGEVACPFCGSPDVRPASPFGSAVCRSAAYCDRCRTPFEVLKDKRSTGGAAPVSGAPDVPAPVGPPAGGHPAP